MRKNILFLFLVIFNIQGVNCQNTEEYNSQLHFVMAYVEKDRWSYSEPDKELYTKAIYTIVNDTLKIVDTLNSRDYFQFNNFIHYPKQQLFYFEESNILDNEPKVYSFLDYRGDSLITRRHLKLNRNDGVKDNLNKVLVEKNGNLVFVNEIQYSDKRGLYTEFGYDKYFNRLLIEPKDFNNIIIYGNSGFVKSNLGSQKFTYVWNNFDTLKIYKFSDYSIFQNKQHEGLPNAFIQPPRELNPNNNTHFYLILNTSKYCIGRFEGGGIDRHNGSTPLLFFNKIADRWIEITEIDSVDNNMRIFDDWLAIRQKAKPNDFGEKQLIKQKYDFTYGKPIITSVKDKLTLMHLPTLRTLEWNVEDKDSEILHVDGNNIYYRVFDVVYFVNIDLDGFKINWKSKKQVIKDTKIIPNVHWMFFSSARGNIEKDGNTLLLIDTIRNELGDVNLNSSTISTWLKFKSSVETRKNLGFINEYIRSYGKLDSNETPFFGENGFWLPDSIKNQFDIVGLSYSKSFNENTLRKRHGTKDVVLKNGYRIIEIEKYNPIEDLWEIKGKTAILPDTWTEDKICEEFILAKIGKEIYNSELNIYESNFSDGTKVILFNKYIVPIFN